MKHPINPENKFQCIEEDAYGEIKGGEYCYYMFYWPESYEERF